MFKVYNGQSSFVYLPFRCSDANFSTDNLYTFFQSMPNNTASSVNTINLQTM